MSARPTPRSPRMLGSACAGLAVSSLAMWGAQQAVWYRVTATVAERGEQVVAFTGAQVRPSLGGVALLALAGVAGVVATAGPLRRAVGTLLALAGTAVGAGGVSGLLSSPFASDGPASSLPTPPVGVPVDALRGQPTEITAAPLWAVLGGLLLVAVGVVVALHERRLPRFGARYATARADEGAARPAPLDPDRAAWQDLDAGRDPTDPDATPSTDGEHTGPDQPGVRRAGPDGGPSNGAG